MKLFNKQQENHIPEDIMDALRSIAARKNVSVEQIIQMQLRAYVNAFERYRILGLDDVMPFGKYRGELIKDIIDIDARYINFLIQDSGYLRLDDNTLAYLQGC